MEGLLESLAVIGGLFVHYCSLCDLGFAGVLYCILELPSSGNYAIF